MISNADIRKGMLRNMSDLNGMKAESLMNTSPFSLKEKRTVGELMKAIRNCTFPISYLPIIDNENRAKGIVTFVNLIKGEL